MKQNIGKYHKNLAALVITLMLSLLLVICHLSGLLDYMEFRFYDMRINFYTRTSRPSNDIIVVLLDQESIDWGQREKGWGWPWPRSAYAEFLDYMNLGQVESVIFDILFSEPSIYGNFNIDDDSLFAEAGERFGRTVHGVLLSTVSGSLESWPSDLDIPLFNPENFGDLISAYDLLSVNSRVGAQFPIESLRNSAKAVGNLTGISDSDNIFRRQHLFMIFDGRAVPSLAAAAILTGNDNADIFYDEQKRQIIWGDYAIPVDKNGKSLLRYRGPLSRYPSYSMSHVLQSAEDHALGRSPVLPPENFAGAHVFFGLFAQGLFDTFSTPIDNVYPGMGVHITMLDNLLMNDFISTIPPAAEVLIISLSVILVVCLVFYSKRVSITVAGLISSILIITAAGFLAMDAGFWLPMAAPLIAVMLSYISSTIYSYATEGRDKRFIKHAFSRVISPKVVDQIIADPAQLRLGGEKRELTAIFTDVQRFSTIASELQDRYGEDGPKILVSMLNLYLTEMSNIVLANDGTIDKYQGDAIIAFFGAPVWMKDHAKKACYSAVKMKRRELELGSEILDPNGEFHLPMTKLIESGVIRKDRPIFTRFGINTGDMVVGFMGTPEKMDYTIMGNAVNLASRLEGVNKQYDTRGILISEYTRNQIGDDFLVRPLSRVTVFGIPRPLQIFELLDIRADADPKMQEGIEIWENAYKAYEKRDFSLATKLFSELYQLDPSDNTVRYYMERCRDFITSPPSDDWDGVDNLTEK